MQIMQEPVVISGDTVDEGEIPSDVALVTPLVVRLVEKLVHIGCVDKSNQMKIELCLDEAITNAVVHGNKNDFGKVVKVNLFRDDDSWGIVIQDEGAGFSLEELADRPPEDTLWQENGRGIPLMALYMDEVVYYDGGRTVLLRQVQS